MSAIKRRAPAGAGSFEITYSFGFDAAHHFEEAPRGHRYGDLHGHSFRAEVSLRGEARPPHGFVADFALLEKSCANLRDALDHRLLNDVPGLATPSLEHLCQWIWQRLALRFPGLARVTVRRDSLHQACTYHGPPPRRGGKL